MFEPRQIKKGVIIRSVRADDLDAWLTERSKLWPDNKDLAFELDQFFAGDSTDIVECLVAEVNQAFAGFIEINIRNFAEGSRQPQVPYIEAWHVHPSYRGNGIGEALMKAAEDWARQRGFNELASDTTPDNLRSIHLHKKIGFAETERVVCFLKSLDD